MDLSFPRIYKRTANLRFSTVTFVDLFLLNIKKTSLPRTESTDTGRIPV